jgi:F-type H+-transporting ATPase subunit delta
MTDPRRRRIPPEELPVARVYAQAAWNLAVRDGAQEDFLAEYEEMVRSLLDGPDDFEKFFRAASIGRDARAAVLEKALLGKTSDLLYNFLLTLNRHDRLGLARAVGAALRELSDKANGLVAVEVRTATPLSPEKQAQTADLVRRRFHVEPRLEVHHDPAILGGLWVRVGDVVFDGTIRTNLRKLRDSLRMRNIYEIQSGRNFFDSPGRN